MVIVSQHQYDEMVELMQQLREKKSDNGFTQALSQRFDELIAGMNRSGQARLALLGGELEPAVGWLQSFDKQLTGATMFLWLEVPLVTNLPLPNP